MTNPWVPVSPCGDGCLPPVESVPRVGPVRRMWRLLAVGGVLLAAAVLAASLPALSGAGRQRALRRWFRMLLTALDVRIEVSGGSRFGSAVLVVSNHMSWLDVVALNAVQPLRMLAKSEVAGWAVIGPLARRAGTLYVDRERLSTLPNTVTDMAGALRGGAAVGAFPEATTWCGLVGGRFRPAVFQAALDAGAAVRPVALRYWLAGIAAPTTVASFVGTATLWQSIIHVAGVRGLVVQVRLLPAIDSRRDGIDRRELAAAAGAAVERATLGASVRQRRILTPVWRTFRVPERQAAARPRRGGVPA